MQVQAPPQVNIGAETIEQACSVASSAIHHLLFAKGQVEQPIAVMKKQRLQIEDGQGGHRRATFSLRRDARRREEMLKGLDILHKDLLSLLQIADGEQAAHEAVILLRMGQSPSSSAKQQYFLILRGLADLGHNRADAPPAAKPRQPFGVKTVNTASARSAALERKLVRFLLSQSGQESQLGRALNADLGPTRTQVFLSMRNLKSTPSGWTHKRSLNAVLQQIEQGHTFPQSAVEGHQIDSAPPPPRHVEEDIDTLVQALSPLKRRILKSPEAKDVRGSEGAIRPLRFSIGASNDAHPPTATVGVTSSELTELDFKRLARRRAKIAGHAAGSASRPATSHVTRRKPARRKGPTSAAFIINFGADNDDQPERIIDRFEHRSWLGSNVILRSCYC